MINITPARLPIQTINFINRHTHNLMISDGLNSMWLHLNTTCTNILFLTLLVFFVIMLVLIMHVDFSLYNLLLLLNVVDIELKLVFIKAGYRISVFFSAMSSYLNFS